MELNKHLLWLTWSKPEVERGERRPRRTFQPSFAGYHEPADRARPDPTEPQQRPRETPAVPDHARTVRTFFETWKKGDVDGLVAFFAPEGTWQEAHREPARGPEELRPVFELQVGFGTDFDFQYRFLAQVDDHRVVSERVDSWTYDGVRMTVEVMGVFEFDDHGKIVRFRDYYDWADLAAQLTAVGIDLTGV